MKKVLLLLVVGMTLIAGIIIVIQSQFTSVDVDNYEVQTKNIAIFGDSIVWGSGSDGRVEKSWPSVFADTTGYNVVADSTPGSTYAIGCGYGWDLSIEERSFCSIIETYDFSGFDYLLIAYGTNDYGYVIDMGSDDDTSKTTFKGALNYSFSKLASEYPNLKIIILTPMYAPTDTVENARGYTMSDYIDVIMSTAKKYDIPIIDLNHEMGVDETNYKELYWDNLHPTQSTYIKIGEYVSEAFPGVSN